MKFAKLDNSDRKALEMFREEIQKKSKILIKDFKDKKFKADRFGSKIIKAPYMCLGSKV